MATDRLPDRDRPLLMKKREREVFSRGTSVSVSVSVPRLCPLETKVRQNNPKSTAIDRAHPHGTPEARRDAREALTRPHKIAPKWHKREHQWRASDKQVYLSSWDTHVYLYDSPQGSRALEITMSKTRKTETTTLKRSNTGSGQLLKCSNTSPPPF